MLTHACPLLDANFDSIGYIGSNWGQTLTIGQHDSLARITSSIMIVLLTNCAILALVASSTSCSLSLMLPWAAQHSTARMSQHSTTQHSILALVASSTFCSLSLMLPWAAQHSNTQHNMSQHSRIQHGPKHKLPGWKHSALLSNQKVGLRNVLDYGSRQP